MKTRRLNLCSEALRCALLVAIALVAIGSMSEATAATRRFEMALFASSDPNYTDLSWLRPCQAQPAAPRRSILQVDGRYESSQLGTVLAGCPYDWSRIAAVVIDEPYWVATGGVDWSHPCYPHSSRCDQVYARRTAVANAAAAVKAISPTTRFWVNFSEPEIRWMQHTYFPLPINESYIDVISLDKYEVSFQSVKPYYDWLVAHRPKPQQQLALVPGVFHRDAVVDTNPSTIASYLPGYFNYANALNAGTFTDPMVWVIAGWPGRGAEWDGKDKWGNIYRGIFHPTSAPILSVWAQQFANLKVDRFAGWVDGLDAHGGRIWGWAVDRTTEIPPYVDFWVDGKYWGGTVANQSRPDVGAVYGIAHNRAGFSFNISKFNDHRCHTIKVYAVASTAEQGNNLLIANNYFCFP